MEDLPEVSLLDYVKEPELAKIIKAFSEVTHLACGVVGMPPGGMQQLKTPADIEKYRLINVIGETPFCRAVRSSSAGNRECMKSDLDHASASFRTGAAKCYICHMGLYDVIAPIRIGGRHVANVYLGQFKPTSLKLDEVEQKYEKLLADSDNRQQAAPLAQIKDAFATLPQEPQHNKYALRHLAEILADLISQRATREAALVLTQKVSRQVGPTLNLRSGLAVYLRHAKALLGGDTGAIALVSNNKERLEVYVQDWGNPTEVDNGGEEDYVTQGYISFAAGGPGATAMCYQKGHSIRVNSREELDELVSPQFNFTRNSRQLQSLLIVPIFHGDEVIGTLDVGSPRQNAFNDDAITILELFARDVGSYVRQAQQRIRLVEVFLRPNIDELARTVAYQAPRDVGGTACSVFICTTSPDEAVLRATSERDLENEIGRLHYGRSEKEGFTGWVFKRNAKLCIPGGPKCRTDNMPLELKHAGVIWRGKHTKERGLEEKRMMRESSPFLAVPIRDQQGTCKGVVRIEDRKSGNFTEDDAQMLMTYADFLGRSLERPRRGKSSDRPRTIFLAYHRRIQMEIVKNYLENDLRLRVECYPDADKPEYPSKIVMEMMERSDAAIILYAADIDAPRSRNTPAHGRPNVAYELGMAHQAFGIERTIILREQTVQLPSNVEGISTIIFGPDDLSAKLPGIRPLLEKMGFFSSM